MLLMVLPRHECIQRQVCSPTANSTLCPHRLAPTSSSACLPRLVGPPHLGPRILCPRTPGPPRLRPQVLCPRTLHCPPCQLPTSAPRVSAPHAYLSLRWSMTTGPCTQQHRLPEPSAAAPARHNTFPRPPPSGAAPARARNPISPRFSPSGYPSAPARARLTPLKRRTILCQSIQHHPFPGLPRREPHQRVPEPPPLPRPPPSGAAPARARPSPNPRLRTPEDPRHRTPAPAAPPARNPVTRQFRSLKPRHRPSLAPTSPVSSAPVHTSHPQLHPAVLTGGCGMDHADRLLLRPAASNVLRVKLTFMSRHIDHSR